MVWYEAESEAVQQRIQAAEAKKAVEVVLKLYTGRERVIVDVKTAEPPLDLDALEKVFKTRDVEDEGGYTVFSAQLAAGIYVLPRNDAAIADPPHDLRAEIEELKSDAKRREQEATQKDRKRKAQMDALQKELWRKRRSISHAEHLGAESILAAAVDLQSISTVLLTARSREVTTRVCSSDEASSLQEMLDNASSEDAVQVAYGRILDIATEAIEEPFFRAVDTHEGGIQNTRSKSHIILIERVKTKPHIASVIELKHSFQSGTPHQQAIGQIVDRVTEFTMSQGKRPFWLCAIADKCGIELWRLAAHSKGVDKRSGLLELRMNAQCLGLNLLVGLLMASPKSLGYSPIDLPEGVHLSSGAKLLFSHKIESVPMEQTGRSSGVEIWAGKVEERDQQHAVDTIVKFPGSQEATIEAANLKQIQDHPKLEGRTVRLVDTVQVRGGDIGLVIEPRGEPIVAEKVSPERAFEIVHDVAETVGVLETECDTIHGDLSVGNMVEFMDKILLIDWRTMRSNKQVQNSIFKTGTRVFMALSAILNEGQNTKTELESLGLLLLYLLKNGNALWDSGDMDMTNNRLRRLAVFATEEGRAQILDGIPSEFHSRITKVLDLFYSQGRYKVSPQLNVVQFISALHA